MKNIKNELKAIESKIYLIRGYRVMLDRDLAELYGVETKRLKEQVKRNKKRFPPDFMFPVLNHELTNLRSQIATSNKSRGGSPHFDKLLTNNLLLVKRLKISVIKIFEENIGVK